MVDDSPGAALAGVRQLRADAARNHQRVLEAAREVFAGRGPEAQIEDVARSAGVGIGTVYRRFRTKDELLAAVLELRRQELDSLAARARTAGSPLAGIADLIRAVADSAAADRSFLSTLLPLLAQPVANGGPPRVGLPSSVTDALTDLLAQGHALGQVNDDVTVDDLAPLIAGIATAGHSRADRERSLRVLLDGIRAAR